MRSKYKCIFLVQGEGRGHMTQSISMKQLLTDAGIEVCEVLIGKSEEREVPKFYYNEIEVPVTPMESPNMAFDKDKKSVNPLTTLTKNLSLGKNFAGSLKLIHTAVEKHKPDFIINFYEPLCGFYYLLHKPKAPIISIGHQYMFLNKDFTMPAEHVLANVALNTYTRLTCLGSTKKLALSFYPFADDIEKDIYTVPPLLRKEILTYPASQGNYLLIYLLNSGYRNDIIHWHKHNTNTLLHCFTDDKNAQETEQYDGTLFFHKLDDKKFMELMANAKAVVTTAGFESVCEAMYLGKPVFTVPVKGHHEQFCNSRDAIKTGLSLYGSEFDLCKFTEYIKKENKAANQEYTDWVKQSHGLILEHILTTINTEHSVKHLLPKKEKTALKQATISVK